MKKSTYALITLAVAPFVLFLAFLLIFREPVRNHYYYDNDAVVVEVTYDTIAGNPVAHVIEPFNEVLIVNDEYITSNLVKVNVGTPSYSVEMAEGWDPLVSYKVTDSVLILKVRTDGVDDTASDPITINAPKLQTIINDSDLKISISGNASGLSISNER